MSREVVTQSFDVCLKRYLGGYSEEVPPLPIPNRAVKLLSADGTAQDGWESRSPPSFLNRLID